VTVTGTNFVVGATTVTLGGVAATGVVVQGATLLTGTTPPGAAGAKDLIVSTAGGTATLVGAFTYVAPPTMTSVSPPSGPIGGGTVVTVTGTNFVVGGTTVTVGGAAMLGVVVQNPTQLTGTTPTGTLGAKDVVVTTAGGVATSPGAFTYEPPCAAANSFRVTLASAGYLAVDPTTTAGCVAFPANPAGGADVEYLVVPQSATGVAGRMTSFRLTGDTVTLGPLTDHLMGVGPSLTPPERFHQFLREAERGRDWGSSAAGLGPAAPAPGPAVSRAGASPAVPPVEGDRREFSVCATLTCSSFTKVGAVAEAVGQRLAIYVDTLAPAGGLNAADLDTLIQVFDSRLYAADTAAFGRESDIDGNSVVIVLMTNVVNKLVTAQQCQTQGFVAGFFLGADIDPLFANDSRFNHGEVFYSIVADPSGVLSCSHSRDQVKRLVPVTFVHEFQHMISYNQHVLVRNGAAEELWLNEALSHLAEEIGGRTYLAEGDATNFSRFVIGNLFNAYSYLDAPGNHFLLPAAGIGTLAERGAGWLFLRYLVDQVSADTTLAAQNAFTRSLVETPLIGSTNLANRAGQPFDRTVTRWVLANWVSDLPSFAAPPELQYRSWSFRAVFASLNAQQPTFFPKPFPLVPTASAGEAVNLLGTSRAGSGVYHRVIQPTGGMAFTLHFSDGMGGALTGTASPRLGVIRIK
jgi:hypothetical protein